MEDKDKGEKNTVLTNCKILPFAKSQIKHFTLILLYIKSISEILKTPPGSMVHPKASEVATPWLFIPEQMLLTLTQSTLESIEQGLGNKIYLYSLLPTQSLCLRLLHES